MNKVEQFFKKSRFPFILFICWALWLSHQIWYLHSLLSLLVQETGTEECTSEALKAAVAVKGHRRQGKVKRENPKSVNTKYPFPFTKNKGQLKNQMRSLNSRINRALTDNQPKNVLSRKDLQCMTWWRISQGRLSTEHLGSFWFSKWA